MTDLFDLLAFLVVLQHLGCEANGCPVRPGPLRWVCRCKRAAAEWADAIGRRP